jgi:glycosyltransferase involved in cell wall biosynthesis
MPGRRTKLLAVSSSLGEGGAQRVTSTLLTHLDRSAIEPALYLFRGKISYPLPDDVAVSVFRGGGDLPISEAARTRPWLVARTIAALRRHIENTRPDVVFSSIDQVNCVTGTALWRGRRRPRWIARVGAEPGREPRLQTVWARWAYRRADAIVVNSQRMVPQFEHLFPATRGRVHHIPNPTDFDAIDRLARAEPLRWRDPSRRLLITVGRLAREKRPDLLIAAVDRLRQTIPIELWICGDGPLRSQLERDIRARGMEGTVSLLGFCDNPYALVRQADLFLLTSEWEGLPNVLIEAQGLGVPAVATDCRFGPSEIIDDERTGLLAPPDDVDALAEAIGTLLLDEPRRRAMGESARARSRSRYGVGQLMATWQAVLTDSHRRAEKISASSPASG